MENTWKDEGACKGYRNSGLTWFPEGTGQEAVAMREVVMKICNEECPDHIRRQCLDHAVRFEQHGVWGGTAERERRRIRVSQRIIATSPQAGYYDVRRDIRTKSPSELPSYLNAHATTSKTLLGGAV